MDEYGELLADIRKGAALFEERIANIDDHFEKADEEIINSMSMKNSKLDTFSNGFCQHARTATRTKVKVFSIEETHLSLHLSQLKHLISSIATPKTSKRSESNWQRIIAHFKDTTDVITAPRKRYIHPLNVKLPEFISASMHIDELLKSVSYGFPSISLRPGAEWPPKLTTPLMKSDGTDLKPVGNYVGKKFNRPWGVAVHPTKGTIYLSDQWNHRILALTPDLELLWFVEKNESFGTMGYPCAISVSLDGRIAVADYEKRRILIFDEDGEFVTSKEVSTLTCEDRGAPFLLAFDTLGRLWLCLDKASSIPVLDKEYNCVMSIPLENLPNGNIAEPHGIVCTDQRDILVACRNAEEVLVFHEETGTLVQKIPVTKTDSSGVNFLTYGPNGTFALSNENVDRLEFFDRSGAILHTVNIKKPLGIAFGLDGRFYIASTSLNTIQVF